MILEKKAILSNQFLGKLKTLPAINQVVLLPISDIQEDQTQPRTEFDEEALKTLADSIVLKGVMQPITVRNLGAGQYVVVQGARRLRASKLAYQEKIPAIVLSSNQEKVFDDFSQIMENTKRSDLDPREIAIFIEKHLQAGVSETEIAKKLAVTKDYVTIHKSFVGCPEEVERAYLEGKLTSPRSVYNARKLFELDKNAFVELIFENDHVSIDRLAQALIEAKTLSPEEKESKEIDVKEDVHLTPSQKNTPLRGMRDLLSHSPQKIPLHQKSLSKREHELASSQVQQKIEELMDRLHLFFKTSPEHVEGYLLTREDSQNLLGFFGRESFEA